MKRKASEHLETENLAVTKSKTTQEPPTNYTKLPQHNGDTRDVVKNQRGGKGLKVFILGEKSAGELGIGSKGRVQDIKYPLLNPLLCDAGIFKIAVGGMHQVFLTTDGRILTCGVNDEGALGRDTVEGSDENDDDDDNGLNRLEATPLEVDMRNVPRAPSLQDCHWG